jgi:DNA polymerase-3 subunit epsilon
VSWHRERMAVFDTETTGQDPEEARIVSACLGAVGGAMDTRVAYHLVNPGVDIPEEATRVHGITNEQAQTNGLDPGVIVEELTEKLTSWWATGSPVVAYNAAYDFTVLDRECRRHLGTAFEVSGPVVDPFVIDREMDKFRKGKRTLTATAQHYGVRLDGAHDATQDALAAARVAWRIAEKYRRVQALTLPELHAAQVGWHAERQADFAAYRQRIGQPVDDVSGEWPVRALLVGADAL